MKPEKKECGNCTLCCKLPQLNDEQGNKLKDCFTWCEQCNIGKGCKIYDNKPKNCNDFSCLYREGLLNISPHKSGFFVFVENDTAEIHKVLTIFCEPHKINNLKKNIMKEPALRVFLSEGWRFIVRYDNNDKHRALISAKTLVS